MHTENTKRTKGKRKECCSASALSVYVHYLHVYFIAPPRYPITRPKIPSLFYKEGETPRFLLTHLPTFYPIYGDRGGQKRRRNHLRSHPRFRVIIILQQQSHLPYLYINRRFISQTTDRNVKKTTKSFHLISFPPPSPTYIEPLQSFHPAVS
jgi:hypothetical protein